MSYRSLMAEAAEWDRDRAAGTAGTVEWDRRHDEISGAETRRVLRAQVESQFTVDANGQPLSSPNAHSATPPGA